MVKMHSFVIIQLIKNTLQDVGIDVSKTTIKRRLRQNNMRVLHKMQTPGNSQE